MGWAHFSEMTGYELDLETQVRFGQVQRESKDYAGVRRKSRYIQMGMAY